MPDIESYFKPINDSFEQENILAPADASSLLSYIVQYKADGHFPDLEKAHIAIIGVLEDRAAVNNQGCANAANAVREKLYKLKKGSWDLKILDLGDIRPGHYITDTYFAVAEVCAALIKKNIIPLVIGGSQDITFAQYRAYEKLEQTVNIVAVDAKFDLGDPEGELDSQSYLGKIILHQPNFLFNYSNIGYQTYFVGVDSVQMMEGLYFDTYRLGNVRAELEEVEPIVRNADMITFDIGSIRQSDAPGNGAASPNGFYGEEACQIARYAGLSDKLSSIGFYELNPSLDTNKQTAHLLAQIIWYFIEGVANRKKDFLLASKTGFVKYIVPIKDSEHEIVFYKSKKSERWWMEVPYMENKTRYYRHHIVPCSSKDYLKASNNDIPELWWSTFKKLS